MGDRARDIRLLDSYLIAFGAGLVVLGLLVLPWFDWADGQGLRVTVVGIALLFMGGRVRRSERNAIDLWKTLDASREVTVSDLTLTTGWPRRRILKNVALVNTVPGVDYVHLPERDLIVDRRLMRTVRVREECRSCGYSITDMVPLHLREAPACPSCGAGMTTDVNEQKQALLDRLGRETAEYHDPAQFNGCLFLALWVVPPVAIGYAATKLMNHRERSQRS